MMEPATVTGNVHPYLNGGFLPRLTILVGSLFLFAVGIVLTLRSQLGLGPWDVLHQGLASHTPLSFGTANVVTGLVVLAVTIGLGLRPGLGTLLNATLIGVFVDLVVRTRTVGVAHGFIAGLATDVGGVLLIAVATALYIGAGMGAGPRDSLMVAISARSGARIGVSRMMVEFSALGAGAALGGSVGIGTVVFALGVGPGVEGSFAILRRTPFVVGGARRSGE
jgi:uncharacterized protein